MARKSSTATGNQRIIYLLFIDGVYMVRWSWYEIDRTTIDTCIELTTLQVESVVCRNVVNKTPNKNVHNRAVVAETL